jgi:hypothetical protein
VPGGAAGFWSYVHEDNDAEGGRIRDPAKRVSAAYRLLTAEDLDLFVDHEDITWGDEWSARIDEAIAGTTFFIPIVTPSYFKSTECRRELLKFAAEATRLGLEKLLMPIYWVSVAELERDGDSAPDEAIAIVARYNWEDLREARLEDPDSAAFRKVVNSLAEELVKRTEYVASIETSSGASTREGRSPASAAGDATSEDESADDDEPGLVEVLAASEEAAPQLGIILQELGDEIERVGAIADAATARMTKSDARGAGMKGRLVATEQMAREIAAPAERIQELGHRYAAALVTLDPGILTALDAAEDPEVASDPSRDEFLNVIQDLTAAADPALGELSNLVESLRQAAGWSRSLRRPLGQMRTGLQGVLDGKGIIDEWGRRAAEVGHTTDEPAPGEAPVPPHEPPPPTDGGAAPLP